MFSGMLFLDYFIVVIDFFDDVVLNYVVWCIVVWVVVGNMGGDIGR